MSGDVVDNKEVNRTARNVGKVLRVLYEHPWATVDNLVKLIKNEDKKMNYKKVSRILRGLELEKVVFSIGGKKQKVLDSDKEIDYVGFIPLKLIKNDKSRKYVIVLRIDKGVGALPEVEEVILRWLFAIVENPELAERKLRELGALEGELDETIRLIVIKSFVMRSIYENEVELIRHYLKLSRKRIFEEEMEKVCSDLHISIDKRPIKISKKDEGWTYAKLYWTIISKKIEDAYIRLYKTYPRQLKNYLSRYIERITPYTLDLLNRAYDMKDAATSLKDKLLEKGAKKFLEELRKRIEELEELGLNKKELKEFREVLREIERLK